MQELTTPPRLFSKRFITYGGIVILITGIILWLSGSFTEEQNQQPNDFEIMDSVEVVKPTDV